MQSLWWYRSYDAENMLEALQLAVRANVEEGVCGGLTLVCRVLRRCVAAVLRCCVPRSALCTLHLLEERVHATMLTRTHTYTHSTASHLFISGTCAT